MRLCQERIEFAREVVRLTHGGKFVSIRQRPFETGTLCVWSLLAATVINCPEDAAHDGGEPPVLRIISRRVAQPLLWNVAGRAL